MKEGYDLVYERPHTLLTTRMHYCPGCFHSTMHKLLMEVVQEMDIQDKTIGVCPVGCSVFAYDYLDIDMQEAAHGRAAAVGGRLGRRGTGGAAPATAAGGQRAAPELHRPALFRRAK